jgi:hypothetical protein
MYMAASQELLDTMDLVIYVLISEAFKSTHCPLRDALYLQVFWVSIQ